MTSSELVPLIPNWIEILKQSRMAFCDAMKAKFGCTVVIHNMESETDSSFGSNKGTVKPEIKYSKQLSKSVTISVWKDDLTTHKVDAVVNAANDHLDHGGGLALALCKAGGPQIQQESDQHITARGIVPTGEAAVTSAGNLPCRLIIHAVGPRVSPSPTKTEIDKASSLLEKAVWSILQITSFHNLQSVAIPAISSGLFNFPLDHCADIIVSTLRKYVEIQNSQSMRLEIRLVNHDDPSVNEMMRACIRILGPPDSQRKAMEMQSKATSGPALSSLKMGNVTLNLKMGSIEEEKTDVIVNTIGSDLDLSNGFVSKAILRKAGPAIQQEIKKLGKPYNNGGQCIETRGYDLNCSAVYHTVCVSKGFKNSASQILHDVIIHCIKKASERFSSISFPAIGTGNLGFQKEEVSKIMVRAVAEFAKKHKGKKMDVYFVIFPKDREIFKAFEMEMDSFEKTQSTSKFSSRSEGRSSVFHDSEEFSGTTPFIELYCDSVEALREAKAWAMRIMNRSSGEVTISNNHVIQFGQDDHEKLMSLQAKFSVFITEFFRDGKCGLTIIGDFPAVTSAALEVEVMLCQAQEEFARAESNDLLHSLVWWQASPGSEERVSKATMQKDTLSLSSTLPKMESISHYARTLVDDNSRAGKDRKRKFENCGLNIVKVEKIENSALKQVFELNKNRVPGKPQQLYQRVTAQFCDLICRVGFQREYAPPREQKYGAGIYFTVDVKNAISLWQEDQEEYIYIVEAQVLTGNDVLGGPQMIVPPTLPTDPLGHYDSVTSSKKDTYVIFNGQQAIPEFLITCKNMRGSTSV